MARTRSNVPAEVSYRIEAVETAVKATIRQVTSPGVRDAMWSAWQDALAVEIDADSPGRMPWERESVATVITEESAHRAMVRMLEAITDIDSRRSIRDVLALEVEFTPTEDTDDNTGIHKTCEHCGRLSHRLVLCVIVGNGGHAVGMTMSGSEDATFR
jgi:hypothetical protein